MKIRETVEKDLSQLKDLFLEDQKYTKGFDEELIVNEQTEKEMEKEIDKIFKEPNSKIFVAEENGKITGFIIPTFSPGITKGGWISNIFISQFFRRKGIGSKLIEKGINWLKQRGAKKVELTAYKVNQRALSFYKKLHFKKQPAKFVRLGKKIE